MISVVGAADERNEDDEEGSGFCDELQRAL